MWGVHKIYVECLLFCYVHAVPNPRMDLRLKSTTSRWALRLAVRLVSPPNLRRQDAFAIDVHSDSTEVLVRTFTTSGGIPF